MMDRNDRKSRNYFLEECLYFLLLGKHYGLKIDSNDTYDNNK